LKIVANMGRREGAEAEIIATLTSIWDQKRIWEEIG
jgi:hypothetical protein